MMRDNLKATGTFAAFLTVAAIIFCAGRALACDSIEASDNPTCAEWAPISDDVSEDRCAIAKLDLMRMQSEFDSRRRRTVADDPLPSRETILDRLKAGADRIARDCADNSADAR